MVDNLEITLWIFGIDFEPPSYNTLALRVAVELSVRGGPSERSNIITRPDKIIKRLHVNISVIINLENVLKVIMIKTIFDKMVCLHR